jgi:hypothetical protein
VALSNLRRTKIRLSVSVMNECVSVMLVVILAWVSWPMTCIWRVVQRPAGIGVRHVSGFIRI